MNPEIITAFAAGVATAALSGGITAAVTLRKVLHRSDVWKDLVERDAHGADALTGLYDREGFVSAVEDLTVTAAETNGSGYLLCVLAYNGFRQIEATYGTLAAEHVLADIGADLAEYAVNGLACRFEYPCFALVTTAADANRLAERMQVAICSSTSKFENALRTGDRYVFTVFGEVAEEADEIYGPALHLELGIDETRVDHCDDPDALLDALALEAADAFLEVGQCRN